MIAASQVTSPPASEPRRSEVAGFWALARGYWNGPQRWRARLLGLGAVSASLAYVLLQLRLNLWLGEFFNTLDAYDRAKAVELVFAFLVIAAAAMAANALQIQARMSWQFDLRRWLAAQLIERWLGLGRHYVLQFESVGQDNPDQRIAEDVQVVADAAIDFAIGLLQSGLLLASFIGVLWSVSGALAIGGLVVPGHLVFVAVAYAGIGLALTHMSGRELPLIHGRRRAGEGDLRSQLVHVREHSEGIAFLGGEAIERQALERHLDGLSGTWRRLVRRQRLVTLVTTGYATAAPVVPLLVAIPAYLSGAMTIGGLVQASAAFVQIQVALGFLVDNYARIADWRAAIGRVLALAEGLDRVAAEYSHSPARSIVVGESDDGRVRFANVHLDGPDGLVVVEQADVEIATGEKVLVVGESGAGKTTLVRAAARLWPWGRGRIDLPRGARLAFMAERPYFPNTTLRTALTYPETPERFDAAALAAALTRVGLPQLVERLDETARWDQALTVGEQQQLGFARLVLHRPDCVFMDEATTALDEEMLRRLMSIFREELAATTLISVDHRPGLDAYHDRSLSLAKVADAEHGTNGARGAATVIVAPSMPAALPAWMRRIGRAIRPRNDGSRSGS